MSEAVKPPQRPTPLWGSYGPSYAVEKYDFWQCKKSNPPEIDSEPIIKKFPDTKRAP